MFVSNYCLNVKTVVVAKLLKDAFVVYLHKDYKAVALRTQQPKDNQRCKQKYVSRKRDIDEWKCSLLILGILCNVCPSQTEIFKEKFLP